MAFNFTEKQSAYLNQPSYMQIANSYNTKNKPEKLFPTGKNIGIAFLDTGISPMADFVQPNNRIIFFKDFINNKKKPYDDNGHGTHVSGISCGNGILSNDKYTGLAKDSNIISLKILDSTGQGTSSYAISALIWIFDNAHKYNIKVVNLSIGSNDKKINHPLKASVEALWKKGIVVIAAAANPDGQKNFIPNPPLSHNIITVGAYEDIEYFKHSTPIAKNNSPTVFANGEEIVSLLSPHYRFTLPNRNRNNIRGKNYIAMSGASMATPFISGVVATILERRPNLTPIEIKNILINMANENNGFINKDYYYSNGERWF